MEENRPGELVVVEVRWEQKSRNGWLLRQVLDLLLPDPHDLTDRDTLPLKQRDVQAEQQGSERRSGLAFVRCSLLRDKPLKETGDVEGERKRKHIQTNGGDRAKGRPKREDVQSEQGHVGPHQTGGQEPKAKQRAKSFDERRNNAREQDESQ